MRAAKIHGLMVAAALAAAPMAALAADDTAQLAARLAQAGGGATFDQIIAKLVPQLKDNLTRQLTGSPQFQQTEKTHPGLDKQTDAIVADEFQSFARDMKGDLLDAMAKALAVQMKPDTMRKALAFFQSDAGRDFLQTQPAVMASVMAQLQGRIDARGHEMGQRIQKRMQEAVYKTAPAKPAN